MHAHIHVSAHLRAHMPAHKHTVWYTDLPPSLKLMAVCAHTHTHTVARGVFIFPTSVNGPYEVSYLDKVERWAALHMSVYYESQ